MNFPALGIRRKLALMTLMSLLPLLLLGVALSVYLISDTLRQNNLRQEDIAFTSIDYGLKFETPMMHGDILFLVTLPAIQEIFRARAHQDVDPISGVPSEKLLQRLQGVFSHFLVTQKIYDQIQFIDKSGQEVVRVDLAGDRAEVIPPAQLQYKGDRYYFRETAKLPKGEVYVSLIDINRDWGKLEQPLKPMLRIVTPIHDAAGIFQGVLVLNKFADRFLSQIMQASKTISGLWFVADDRGYYVYHSQDPERLWGGPEDLNTGEGLCKDFPQQCQQLLSGKSTSVIWQGRTWLVYPRRYNLWPGHARFITIAHMTPQPGFADHFNGDTWLLIGAALLAALLAGLSTWWNGRRISRPIQNLAAAMQQFRQGQRGARAEVTSRDEIGALCEDFNAMADTLTQVTDNLEEEVTKRTLDLLITTNKLQALIQASPVAIISLDMEGKVTSWNKAAEILFGWTEEEVLGKPLPIVLEEEQEQFRTLLRDIRGGEVILRVETRRRRKDGAIIEVSRSIAPVLDAAGKVIGVIGLLEDITAVRQAQKALQESEAFNRITLNSISEHLAVLDGNGVILRTNKSWEDYAAANSLSHSLIGENYLAICDQAKGPGSDEARLAAQGIREVMQGNLDIFSLEYSCHSPDEQCWFQMHANPFGRDGETGVVVAHLNITRLKETEREQQRLLEQLKAGQNLLQAVLEQMPAGVIIVEPSPGRIILSNRRAEGLWEQPPGFLTDLEKFLQIPRYYPDGRAYSRDDIPLLRALTRGETIMDEEMLVERETGDCAHYIHLNVNAAPIRDSQGKIIAGVVTFLDITQRRQAEEALRQSQEQMHLLLESTEQGIYGIDLDGGCTFINRAALEMLQYSRAEVMGKRMHQLVHHTHADGTPYPEADCPGNQVLSTGIGAQLDDEALWRLDGSVFPAHYSSYPLKSEGRIIGAVVSFSDITARKQAEETLRDSEERFRTLVELAPDIIYRLDEKGRILFISPAVRQLGYQPEDLVGRKFEEIVYPEDRQQGPHTFVEHRIGERAMKNLEIRLTTKEGALRDYSFNFLTFSLYSRGVWDVTDDQIMLPEKKFLCTQGIARDISDRKRAQEALTEQSEILRRSEARFRVLFEGSHDALITLEPPSGRLTSCNPATIAMFGARDEADFLSRFTSQYSPERQPDGSDSTEKIQEWGETAVREGSCFFEWAAARIDGTEFPATILLTRMEFAGETILQATIRDITPQKRAEEAMKNNSAFLNTLLNTIPAPVFFKDTEGRYLGFNKAFETYYGKTEEELVGKSVFDIAPKEMAEIYHARDTELYQNPGIQVYEAKLKDARDQSHDVIYHKATFMNPDGKMGGLIGVILDITERKRVEELLAWQTRVDAGLVRLSAELLVEASVEEISALVLKEAQQLTDSPNGFVGYLDRQTGYLVCPTLTRDMLKGCQVQYGEVVFKDFRGLFGWVLDKRRPLLTNTPDSDPRSTGVPQGHAPISRFLSVPALLGDELVGQVALANASRDYTDQDLVVVKRLADLFSLAIQRHRWEMELQAAIDAAEAANRAKSDFLSGMSHELRTPMNAIIGFSEILQDQHFGPLNEKQSRQINHILISGRHLLSLINDILDLSKVESGKMTLELTSVGIADLIQTSLVMIKEKALKHQLHLETDLAPDLADLSIVADERKLKQIMFNLLSNAAKYTPDGGEITVTAKREAGNLVVSVADTGIGIAPEDRERIFEAFERVDSSYARQQEGTGLGLALTRRMVEIHRGRIWVESAGKDQGSTFIFIIPLQSGVEPESLPKNNA